MLNNHAACKYEISYKGPFLITQCWINATFTLQCGTKNIKYNIRLIKPHTSETNVEDINFKINDWLRHIKEAPAVYFCIL